MQSTSSRTLSLIIPCYNEEDAVGPMIERLLPVAAKLAKNWSIELVVVDDGSTDRTYSLLTAGLAHFPHGRVRILHHLKNKGIGAATRSGFEAATGQIVCTMDSDCTYAPEDLERLIQTLLASEADIVTGSPYHPLGEVHNVAKWRLFVSKSASWLYGRLLPAKLYCYTSFFRAYRREWARPELVHSDGFLGVAEILVGASTFGARIVECPVALSSRIHGVSKMKTLRTTKHHLGLMWRTARMNYSLTGDIFSPAEEPETELPAPMREVRGEDRGEAFDPMLDRLVLCGRFDSK